MLRYYIHLIYHTDLNSDFTTFVRVHGDLFQPYYSSIQTLIVACICTFPETQIQIYERHTALEIARRDSNHHFSRNSDPELIIIEKNGKSSENNIRGVAELGRLQYLER
jgi:hypothetical protein